MNINQFTTYYDVDHLSKEIRRDWGILRRGGQRSLRSTLRSDPSRLGAPDDDPLVPILSPLFEQRDEGLANYTDLEPTA
jgi:hypothetical protein